MYDWFARTLVPIIVGTVLSVGAKYGFDLDATATAIVVTGLLIGAYNLLARGIEGMWPGAGRVLMSLGLSKNVPAYVRSNDPFLASKPPADGGRPAPPGTVS